jgi:hypothetical protein
MNNKVAHSTRSSHREALLEHLLAGEVMKHLWRRPDPRDVFRARVRWRSCDTSLFTVAEALNDPMSPLMQKRVLRKASRTTRFQVSADNPREDRKTVSRLQRH